MYLKYVCFSAVCLMVTQFVHAQNIETIKDQKPFTIHGGISAGINYNINLARKDSLSKLSFGQSPSYFIQANPVFSVYGFNIPVSILLASQSTSLSSPVFSRFGLSPQYKWVRLHLGWRSLNFSQFTLGGQQMLGAGFEVNPGKFRVACMYGKFNNAVTDISLYNNLNSNIPVYKRTGFAAKIGYGTDKNFIELSYLQAKDDSNSLKNVLLDTLAVKPAANQVAGIKGMATLIRHLTIEGEGAVSYFTGDITAPYLDLNAPLKELAVIKPRTTSKIAVAGDARVRYTFQNGNVSAGYRRVDPGYNSMGTFYMQTDIEQYTAGLNLTMWKRKINFQSRFGWQKNNLAHTAASNSNRTIGNASISINPVNNFGVDLQYSNYGISQQVIPQLRDPATVLRYDSVSISQVNQSFSISPHLFISRKSLQHSFSLQASIQSLNNLNEKMSESDFTSQSASLIYALLFPEKKINITNVFNYFNTALTNNKTELMGYDLAVSKILNSIPAQANFFSSITLALNGGYYMNRLNGVSSGNTLMLNPSVTFAFLKRNSLQLMANYTSTELKSTTYGNKQNMMIAARYQLSF